MMKLALFAVLVAMIGLAEAKVQNISVKGVAICNKLRMKNILVELWEKDTLDPNDKLAYVHTNAEGEFHLTGSDNEVTSIEPYIKFKHTCKVVQKPGQNCTRKTEYDIPKNFIDNPLPYDMTYVNLDIYTNGEKEHCEKIKAN